MMKKISLTLLAALGLANAKPVDLMLGARGYGMGGAYVALSQDVNSSWFNPAGMAHVSGLSLANTTPVLQDVENVSLNGLAAAAPISGVGTVSGSWLLTGATLEQGTGSSYLTRDYSEQTWSLGLSRILAPKLGFLQAPSLGVNLNRHVIDIGDAGNAAGTGLDLGFQTGLGAGFQFGFVARALATDMAGEKVDPEYRYGLGWNRQFGMHGLAFEVDAQSKANVGYESGVDVVDQNWRVLTGLEYVLTVNKFVMGVRGGMNRWLLDELARQEMTLGASLGFAGLQLDYAYGINDQDISLGTSHRIGIVLSLSSLMGDSKPAPSKK